MKKTVAILLSAVLLLLCSCGKSNDNSANTETEPPVSKSADMLNITNNGKSFLDCVSRYNSVVSAVKNKVQILENEHNNSIKNADSEKYFLNENYILTYFDPFLLNSFFLIEGFGENLTEEKAKDFYAAHSNGADIRYEKKTDGSRTLSFISEDSVKKIRVFHVRGQDSFRYTVLTEINGVETAEETLEFVKTDENKYFIQSGNTRLFAEFDSDGNIVYFCCTTLKNSVYTESDSIYNTRFSADKTWAKPLEKDSYLNVHTYENGVLTHEECSSGPWKTVTINESDYASAFIF